MSGVAGPAGHRGGPPDRRRGHRRCWTTGRPGSRERGIDSIAAYRQARTRREITDDPFGDVFLVVDGWGHAAPGVRGAGAAITTLATRGLGFGMHVVLAANRWGEVRMNMRDLLGTKLELRLGDPNESEIDRRAAANVPGTAPGRGLTRDKLHFLDRPTPDRGGRGSRQTCRQAPLPWSGGSRQAGGTARRRKVRLLPQAAALRRAGRPCPTRRPRPVSRSESTRPTSPRSTWISAANPHLLVFGDAECGKTNLLRLIAKSIMERHAPSQARFIIADYDAVCSGRSSREHLLDYAPSHQALAEMLPPDPRARIAGRLPGPDVTQEQLRNRSWWYGPELYIIVDDYDLVALPGNNPLTALTGAAAAGPRHRPARDPEPAGRRRGPGACTSRSSNGCGNWTPRAS